MSQSPALAHLVLLQGGGGAADKTTSDADLARALGRGEEAAFQLAFARFAPAVRGNLRRVIGPGLDEDDLCQEVFLHFFRRIVDLRDPNAVRGFLFGVCLRVGRKELRRRWLRRWLRLTDNGALPEPPMEDRDEPADEVREAVTRYYRILDTVGGQGRSLFVARYIEGVALAEVARLHGLSLSTAQRTLNRVAKRIDAMVHGDPILSEIADRVREDSR